MTDDVCEGECTEDQCKVLECKDEDTPYTAVCSPLEIDGARNDSEVLSRVDYCDNAILNETYRTSVFACENACTKL